MAARKASKEHYLTKGSPSCPEVLVLIFASSKIMFSL
jgi:hypothetical protein